MGHSILDLFRRKMLTALCCADIIIVLKDGAVVEQGTHEELLGTNGLYADMWRQQEGEEEESRAD